MNERTPSESIQMNDRQTNSNHFIYYPTIQSDTLPSYSQVMNDIFYLDILTQQSQQHQQHQNEYDGDC